MSCHSCRAGNAGLSAAQSIQMHWGLQGGSTCCPIIPRIEAGRCKSGQIVAFVVHNGVGDRNEVGRHLCVRGSHNHFSLSPSVGANEVHSSSLSKRSRLLHTQLAATFRQMYTNYWYDLGAFMGAFVSITLPVSFRCYNCHSTLASLPLSIHFRAAALSAWFHIS